MDEGLSIDAVKGRGLSSDVGDLFMHFFLKCNYEECVATSQSVTYREGCGADIVFVLKLGGFTL